MNPDRAPDEAAMRMPSGSQRPPIGNERFLQIQLPIKEPHFQMEIPGPTQMTIARIMYAETPMFSLALDNWPESSGTGLGISPSRSMLKKTWVFQRTLFALSSFGGALSTT
jgi:hypothetical protein